MLHDDEVSLSNDGSMISHLPSVLKMRYRIISLLFGTGGKQS